MNENLISEDHARDQEGLPGESSSSSSTGLLAVLQGGLCDGETVELETPVPPRTVVMARGDLILMYNLIPKSPDARGRQLYEFSHFLTR